MKKRNIILQDGQKRQRNINVQQDKLIGQAKHGRNKEDWKRQNRRNMSANEKWRKGSKDMNKRKSGGEVRGTKVNLS